jgi:hypothetical protein
MKVGDRVRYFQKTGRGHAVAYVADVLVVGPLLDKGHPALALGLCSGTGRVIKGFVAHKEDADRWAERWWEEQ